MSAAVEWLEAVRSRGWRWAPVAAAWLLLCLAIPARLRDAAAIEELRIAVACAQRW